MKNALKYTFKYVVNEKDTQNDVLIKASGDTVLKLPSDFSVSVGAPKGASVEQILNATSEGIFAALDGVGLNKGDLIFSDDASNEYTVQRPL